MARRAGRLLVTALLLLAGAAAARAASVPPDLRFRSISTGRVTVHFHQGLEGMARRAATLATEILERRTARYGVHLGRVQIVLLDVEDDPNGFATPLPYPLVQVRAVAPDGSEDFGNYDDWLRLVLNHELTHIVHMEEARKLPAFGRKLLGRAPYLFPNAATPTWMLEGLATYEETQGTLFGRGRNPDVRMVLRMAALEEDFLHEDEPVAGLDRWPAGSAAYFYGEAFLADLAAHDGPGVLPELARVHSGRLIPFLDELTARKVTGSTFSALWSVWRAASREAFEREAQAIRARGLTSSRPLTTRGVRQSAPRFSPDGQWVAFTDRDLTHFRSIHLIRPDGTGERTLVKRNGGSTVSWTPDGRRVVYDEPDTWRLFRLPSDLRVVEVATGRRRWITRGRRARDPDVSPDGRTVAFVRQGPEGSELALVGLDGKELRDLTRSETGTQWGSPRWSPQGDRLVASRWREGGLLDVVLVDTMTGSITPLTEDRAKDVEPSWTPDGRHVVFRSDRDGVSNLYAARLSDGALLRITNVLGGAFQPDVSPDGRTIAFAGYSARGYDIELTDFDPAAAATAEPFVDTYPVSSSVPADPAPLSAPARPYHPAPLLLPRFWTPYVTFATDDTRFGAVTGGSDALFRHVWAADVRYGTGTDRFGGQIFYQYDRFRPTLSASAEDKSEIARGGISRSRHLDLTATLPLHRSLRSAHNLIVAWHRGRDTLEGPASTAPVDRGGIEGAWSFSSARSFPFSISPVEGYRLRVGVTREAPWLGGDVSLDKVAADGRLYTRVFGAADALALRATGGFTAGQPGFTRAFALGGFPDGALSDLVGTNPGVLRGYPDDAFYGRSFVNGSVEYRFPILDPQRGYRLLPLFVRHLHGTVFADVGSAWSGDFRADDLKTGVGTALGADVNVGHALPLTVVFGVAHGLSPGGETRTYFRVGLAF